MKPPSRDIRQVRCLGGGSEWEIPSAIGCEHQGQNRSWTWDGSRGQGGKEKEVVPWRALTWAEKEELVLERRKETSQKQARRGQCPQSQRRWHFQREGEEWPQHGSWGKTQWLGPQSALRVKKTRKPGEERGHTWKEQGPSKMNFCFVLTHSWRRKRGEEVEDTEASPSQSHSSQEGQEEHPYRAQWMKQLIHMGPGDAGLPRASHGHLFSPMVTEIWAWKLFCSNAPEIPWDFHDPLVTSGPALVLEKHYQVKMGPLLQFWWACPVPAGARMAWKHTTAPGWSHPHNSKNIILTPSYQFSAFPFLAHLRSSRGVRRPSQGLVLTLWWAVLSVSMPWLLIFSVWLSPLEGGLCFNFLALERWVFLHKLQETRKARSDVHIVSISEISHFKALASSSYTTSEGGKTWLYPSYPREQLSVHTVG